MSVLNGLLLRLAGVRNMCEVYAYGMPPPTGQPFNPTPMIDEYNRPCRTVALDLIIQLMQDMSETEREATLLLLNKRFGRSE
jgi:hypothetical protein